MKEPPHDFINLMTEQHVCTCTTCVRFLPYAQFLSWNYDFYAFISCSIHPYILLLQPICFSKTQLSWRLPSITARP